MLVTNRYEIKTALNIIKTYPKNIIIKWCKIKTTSTKITSIQNTIKTNITTIET